MYLSLRAHVRCLTCPVTTQNTVAKLSSLNLESSICCWMNGCLPHAVFGHLEEDGGGVFDQSSPPLVRDWQMRQGATDRLGYHSPVMVAMWPGIERRSPGSECSSAANRNTARASPEPKITLAVEIKIIWSIKANCKKSINSFATFPGTNQVLWPTDSVTSPALAVKLFKKNTNNGSCDVRDSATRQVLCTGVAAHVPVDGCRGPRQEHKTSVRLQNSFIRECRSSSMLNSPRLQNVTRKNGHCSFRAQHPSPSYEPELQQKTTTFFF